MSDQTLGEYSIVRELGRGGMGVVYEGWHAAMNRRVAIKLILSSAASPLGLQRFGREALLLARVKHPNVVRVHELGRSPRGPYLVTELLEGEDLGEVLRRGPLEPERAAQIAQALASALSTLHAEGIVHRDLKPPNVMIRSDGTPALLDFGLARDVGAEKLTQTGVAIGTPAYMPPEQVEGSSETLDARSDIYGLGAILFSMLSSRPPFEGTSEISLMKQVLLAEPRWPSAIAATS